MKDQEIKEKFVVLRAKGFSYAKIAEELQVSKQTLINWSKSLECEIENLRAIAFEELQEKYYVAKTKRVELLGEQLQRLREEISRRDLTAVPTDKLLSLFLRFVLSLKEEEIKTAFSEYEAFDFGFSGSKQSWPG